MQLWVFPEVASPIPPLPSDALTHLRDYPSKHSPLGWGVVLGAWSVPTARVCMLPYQDVAEQLEL